MELTLQQKRLERLKNYRTRYELALVRGAEKILICYSASRTRESIYRSCAHRIESVMKYTQTDQIHFGKRVSDGATMGEWVIRFTGRTQRDCILAGELPYIGDVCAPRIVAELPEKTVYVGIM